MGEVPQFRATSVSPALAERPVGAMAGVGERLKLFFHRAIFWPYERGSWQYDIICAIILAFIFLTPRSWFHDRPQLELTDLRHRQGIVDVGHAKEGWRYLIDARLVESMAPLPPEEAVREILRRRLSKPFTIESVGPIRDKNNVLLGYEVVILQ